MFGLLHTTEESVDGQEVGADRQGNHGEGEGEEFEDYGSE